MLTFTAKKHLINQNVWLIDVIFLTIIWEFLINHLIIRLSKPCCHIRFQDEHTLQFGKPSNYNAGNRLCKPRMPN